MASTSASNGPNGSTLQGLPVARNYPQAFRPIKCLPTANSLKFVPPKVTMERQTRLVTNMPQYITRVANSTDITTNQVANSTDITTKKPLPPLVLTNKKSNQTFVIRTMQKQGPHKDIKNLKYIGTFMKNVKDGGTNQADSGLVLVSTSSTIDPSSSFVMTNANKSIMVAQGQKRIKMILTPEGTLTAKPPHVNATTVVPRGAGTLRIVPAPLPTVPPVPPVPPVTVVPTVSDDLAYIAQTAQTVPQPAPEVIRLRQQEKFVPISQIAGTTYKTASSQMLIPINNPRKVDAIKKTLTAPGSITSNLETPISRIVSTSSPVNTSDSTSSPPVPTASLGCFRKITKSGNIKRLVSTDNDYSVSSSTSNSVRHSLPSIKNTNSKPRRMSLEDRKAEHAHPKALKPCVKTGRIKIYEKLMREVKSTGVLVVSEEPKWKARANEDRDEWLDLWNAEKNSENTHVKKEPDTRLDYDLTQDLDWSECTGTLQGSDIKFKLNDLGIIVILEKKEEVADEVGAKKEDEKQKSPESFLVADSEEKVKKETTDEKEEESVKTDKSEETYSEEFLCCQSCGTYGMRSDFTNVRFCSASCTDAHAEEKAQNARKIAEKQERKMKLKKQKTLLLEQRAHLEKLGLHEARSAIDEKIRMLRMERELIRTNGGESDGESSQGTLVQHENTKSTFSWNKYLTSLKAKAAPCTMFKDPFPMDKNFFKLSMKLEGIDPVHPSLFCVLTVTAIRGYRIRLHFDGYPDHHDFWVNANSPNIFHPGWCERTNHKLSPPKSYGEQSFNWGNYLRMTKTMAAPKSCFVNNQEKTLIPSGFRVGMKLEAVDKKNSSLICVATITDLLDNRILVHFDSWDDIYDYWVDCTSPYIHHVGWCKENGHQLTPPNTYKTASSFSWEYYLHETKSQPAPARAFKARAPIDFRRGMKLECVDKRNPILIRVATVVDVISHQVKIKFDGWPDQFAYWVDDDSQDIHPQGWCFKTGHPLEPPPCAEDLKNTALCPTPGCRGIGHVKGKSYTHNIALLCPYSSMNYLRDDHIPDRFYSKSEYHEVKDSSLSKGTKPRPGIPRKKLKLCETEQTTKACKRGRKRKISMEPEVSPVRKKKTPTTRTEKQTAAEKAEVARSKSLWDVSAMVASIGTESPLGWTPQQVRTFVVEMMQVPDTDNVLMDHLMDGEAFLMLSLEDLISRLLFKVGPAVKLYNAVKSLRKHVLSLKAGPS